MALERGESAPAVARPEVRSPNVAFWEEQARMLTWTTPWAKALERALPHPRWFAGGTLNVAVNCVDRHVQAGHADRVAIHWVGDPGDTATVTYGELQSQVCRAANALVQLGVGPSSTVAIIMPMLPEAAAAMLACARLGAQHAVIVALPHREILAKRIRESGASLVISVDGGYEGRVPVLLKPSLDEALMACPEVKRVLIVRRAGLAVARVPGRDVWWHDIVDQQAQTHAAQSFESNHPLFSMVTAAPGDERRTLVYGSGAYLTHVAATHRMALGLRPDDVCWNTGHLASADGHAYALYGPLANGSTTVLCEANPGSPVQASSGGPLGALRHSGHARCWDVVERFGVTRLTLPQSLVRLFAASPGLLPRERQLKRLRMVATRIEPVEAAGLRMLDAATCELWSKLVGRDRPLVTTWSNEFTGGIMLAARPGPGSTPAPAMQPFPGISVDIVGDDGVSIRGAGAGHLVVDEPWPGMVRSIDPEDGVPCWFRSEGKFFTGEQARLDPDGHLLMLSRRLSGSARPLS